MLLLKSIAHFYCQDPRSVGTPIWSLRAMAQRKEAWKQNHHIQPDALSTTGTAVKHTFKIMRPSLRYFCCELKYVPFNHIKLEWQAILFHLLAPTCLNYVIIGLPSNQVGSDSDTRLHSRQENNSRRLLHRRLSAAWLKQTLEHIL